MYDNFAVDWKLFMKTIGSAFKQRRACGSFARGVPGKNVEQAQVVVAVFALCSLFMMMSFGMTLPTFAHVFKENSSGVVLLSVIMLAPHLALFVLAPLVGNLADRYGRYPFLLLTFAGLVVTNSSTVFAHTPTIYIGIQIFQGIVCVGARPAMMGILADIVPEQQRTRQLSFLMVGFAGGLTLGPACGGFLLQHWGVAAPFAVSACFNFFAFCLIYTMVPRIPAHRLHPQKARWPRLRLYAYAKDLRFALILPLSLFAGLLLLDFVLAFGRIFVEPQLVLYVTKILRFSPVQLGLLLSCHGLTMSLGALVASYLDNRLGRRVTVAGGFLMQALLTLSLLLTHYFPLLLLAALLSGIGSGLVLPLLGTCYLASVKADHQSRICGIKEAVGALGGIVGSLPVLLARHWLTPHNVFVIAGCIIAGGGLFAMGILKAYHASPVVPMIPASGLPLAIPSSAEAKQLVQADRNPSVVR
jgi:DHA1 family multidrug resistance protein-like MFS transporter